MSRTTRNSDRLKKASRRVEILNLSRLASQRTSGPSSRNEGLPVMLASLFSTVFSCLSSVDAAAKTSRSGSGSCAVCLSLSPFP